MSITKSNVAKSPLRATGALVGLAAAFLAALWLFGWFDGDESLSRDPAVADLQRAMQRVDAGGNPNQRKADVKRLIQQYERLSPQQQAEFDRRKMVMYMPDQERELAKFFAQPEAQQWQQIDREIDEIEAKLRQASAKAGKKDGAAADPRRIMAKKQQWSANASPELRSMMDRRVRMINQRREERGLQPL